MGKNRSWLLVRPCPSNCVRLVDNSAWKQEAISCFETSINARYTTRRHIPEHHIYTLLWSDVFSFTFLLAARCLTICQRCVWRIKRTNEQRAFPLNSVAAYRLKFFLFYISLSGQNFGILACLRLVEKGFMEHRGHQSLITQSVDI